MTGEPTILVLRALGLGDFFTGLPALQVLRRARPDARIVLALPRVLWPFALLAGAVDAVVHGYELEPLVDPPHRPELAIDLHGNGPESRDLLRACSPERLVAFNDGGPAWDAEEHEVARWCRLLIEGLPAHLSTQGLSAVPGVAGCLPVPPGAQVPARRTIVHCGAKAPARRWPPDRFAEVARRLQAGGHDVLVTGAADEADLVLAVAREAGVAAAYELTLADLFALVANARLVVCGDTGIAHVASNYRTPSVVLFGPVSPAVWGPPDDPRHQVLWHGGGGGNPHADRPDPALLRISVREVLAAAELASASEKPELVLFDRDGTLIRDVPYNGDPRLVELMPGAAAVVDALREQGIRVGLITNQSGVARGLITREQAAAVNAEVERLVGPFDVVEMCLHGPGDGCACRKPAPGMVLAACAALDVPPYRCVVIGDIASDVQAAHAAGASAILVPTAVTEQDDIDAAPTVVRDLEEAWPLLLGR